MVAAISFQAAAICGDSVTVVGSFENGTVFSRTIASRSLGSGSSALRARQGEVRLESVTPKGLHEGGERAQAEDDDVVRHFRGRVWLQIGAPSSSESTSNTTVQIHENTSQL
jgi:hypothetical protein